MANTIDLTRYDPVTKQYTAMLTVTDAEQNVLGAYMCEGTWNPAQAAMVAAALYDQHKAALAANMTGPEVAAEKLAITTAIAAAVAEMKAK